MARTVPHDDAGLLTVGSDHGNGGPFALLQIGAVIPEGGEVGSDQRHHEGLAATATHHQPRFGSAGWPGGVCRPVCLRNSSELFVVHRQRE